MINSIEFPMTPITEDTFERQGWERHVDTDGGVDEDEPSEYYYYILPLPRDNPDENAPALASSTNDEYKDIPDDLKEITQKYNSYYKKSHYKNNIAISKQQKARWLFKLYFFFCFIYHILTIFNIKNYSSSESSSFIS